MFEVIIVGWLVLLTWFVFWLYKETFGSDAKIYYEIAGIYKYIALCFKEIRKLKGIVPKD